MAKSKTQKTRIANMWEKLDELITEYGESSRADEMKGGGDPLDIREIELTLERDKQKVVAQIEKIRREYE